MKEYWGDAAGTAKTLTKDAWLKTGDLGVIDDEGFLHIRDRIKDLINRGGEKIDSVSVENAVLSDQRLSEAAAVGVPDERLGELPVVIVIVRPQYYGKVKETEVIEISKTLLPKFAVPVMVIVQNEAFELTPSGKVLKAPLRVKAKLEWERRNGDGVTEIPKARL